MSIDDRFPEIEAPAFSAVVNAASTLPVFLSIILAEPSFQRLVEDTLDDMHAPTKILERIRSLSEVHINFEYENPHDAALSAYAWALHKVSPDTARIAAERITSAPNTWWCTQIAARLLREPNLSHSKTATIQHFAVNVVTNIYVEASKAMHTMPWTFVSQGRVQLHRVVKTLNAADSCTDAAWNRHRVVPKPQSSTARSQWVANG
jgi:hypothetical protein